jgi:hypothetical protein
VFCCCPVLKMKNDVILINEVRLQCWVTLRTKEDYYDLISTEIQGAGSAYSFSSSTRYHKYRQARNIAKSVTVKLTAWLPRLTGNHIGSSDLSRDDANGSRGHAILSHSVRPLPVGRLSQHIALLAPFMLISVGDIWNFCIATLLINQSFCFIEVISTALVL